MSAITLIIPPSAFLLDERVFMSLGILKVAAMLEQHNVPVEVLDLSGIENYEEVVAAYCSTLPNPSPSGEGQTAIQGEARIFGITATTPQLPAAANIARSIRNHRITESPNHRIILGGPHATLVAAAYKREQKKKIENGRAAIAFAELQQQFDVIIAGDGEYAIMQALEKDCPPFIDADDPRSALYLNPAVLDTMPLPARHLVDASSYHYSIDGIPAMSLIAQLGCPFECGFCGGRYSPFLRRTRMRSSESVVREIAHLHKTCGMRGFMLYDDELNVNPNMVELMEQLHAYQQREHTEFRLRGFIKSQLFTDVQAAAMHRAGFRWILVGFESGSERILRNINKKATRAENTRCMEIARRHGLKVKALMSVGHPGESPATVQDTIDWLLEVKPDDFDITLITTYPGTPYYDDAVLLVASPDQPAQAVGDSTLSGLEIWMYEYHGDRLYSYEVDYSTTAKYYKGDPDGGYQAYVFTDHLDPEQLVSFRNQAEQIVRKKLNIPYPQAARGLRYEHSMGQGLPPNILRSSH